MDTERRLYVGHIVFVAGLDDIVVFVSVIAVALPRIRAHAVERERAHTVGVFFIVRDGHAAFRGHEIFRHIKAETADIADGPRLPPFVLGLYRMCRVLDYLEFMFFRKRHDSVHIARAPRHVNDDDGFRLFRDLSFDIRYVDVLRVFPAIREDRSGAAVHDRVRGRREGERRHDDLVARLHADYLEREMERRRTGRECDRVSGALVCTECVLELVRFGARPYPAAFQGRDDLVDLRLFDRRRAENEEVVAHIAPL